MPRGSDSKAGTSKTVEPAQQVAPPTEKSPVQEPKYVTADAFEAGLARMEGMIVGMQRGARPEAPAVPKVPTIDEPTEDEITAAYESGDAKAIARIHARQSKAVQQRLEQTFRPQIDDLRSVGLREIGALSKDAAMSRMPHYKRFQKEIDALVAQIPPGAPINSDVYVQLHNVVVGNHYDELMTEVKQGARQEYEQEIQTGRPSARFGRTPGASQEDVPTVGEYFGEQAEEVLSAHGRDPDSFAQKMGYENHAHRIAVLKSFEPPPPPWKLPAGATAKSLRAAREAQAQGK